MADDSFTTVSEESWFSRLGASIKGVLAGFAIFIAAFPLLWWNEGRAVQTARSLEEGESAVVSIDPGSVDRENDKRLVHVTGDATTEETLADSEFNVQATAIKLMREVQMYQWDEESHSETKKKFGGGTRTETTYTYKKVWSRNRIDSTEFQKPEGHTNPAQTAYTGKTWTAKKVTLGAFDLPPSLVARIHDETPLPLKEVPKKLTKTAKRNGDGLYIGADPAAPAIGDTKISWRVVLPCTVSLVARQIGNSFESYKTKAGGNISLLKQGTHSAENMFAAAKQDNKTMTWLLRCGGFLMMLIGLSMIARPIVVFGDVIPLLGDLLGMGTFLFAGLGAFVCSLITVSIAWVVYRPLLGVSLLVVAVGSIIAVKTMRAKKKAAKAAATAPAQAAPTAPAAPAQGNPQAPADKEKVGV